MAKGDTLEITGEKDKLYYKATYNGQEVLVEKRLVRLEGAKTFKEYKVYTQKDAVLSDSPYMDGKTLKTMDLNARVTVKADLGVTMLVEADGTEGYMHARDVSKSKFKAAKKSSGSSSGGGGSTGNDGEDITLEVSGGIIKLSTAKKVKFPVNATALADGVELYYCFMSGSKSAEIFAAVDEAGKFAKVSYESFAGEAPADMLRKDSQEAYKTWKGYSQKDALLCDNYRMLGKIKALKLNTRVQVLDEVGDVCLVKVDKTLGFMEKSQISEKKIKASSSGSSSSGGSSNNEWTDPTL